MISDLLPKFVTTAYCKFAYDLTVLIPGNCSSSTCDEIDHLILWASTNKLSINFKKTKEIVICRPGRGVNLPSCIKDIEQVKDVKLLGVHFSSHLTFGIHINSIISSVNQRLYLMELLRAKGLDACGLSIVFHALILTKMLYASQAFTFSGHAVACQ